MMNMIRSGMFSYHLFDSDKLRYGRGAAKAEIEMPAVDTCCSSCSVLIETKSTS